MDMSFVATSGQVDHSPHSSDKGSAHHISREALVAAAGHNTAWSNTPADLAQQVVNVMDVRSHHLRADRRNSTPNTARSPTLP
mmetsp:Transcript_58192/g.161218  ORF Transcript_58192/g.161218 Transcript_58192/m.161218 type:complete len:83 (+) Transcript_58192:326-574(+)